MTLLESKLANAQGQQDIGLLARLLNAGVPEQTPLETRIAYRYTNLATLFGFFLGVSWTPLAFFLLDSLLLPFVNLVVSVLYMLSFVLMAAGYRKFIPHLVLTLICFHWLATGYVAGPTSGIEFFLVLILAISIVMFTKEQRRERWLGFAIIASSTGLMAFLFLNVPAPVVFPEVAQTVAYYVNTAFILTFIGVVVYTMHFSSIDNFLQFRDARNRTQELVKDLLPDLIADRLNAAEDGEIIADSHSGAAILMADLVGFTKLSRQLSPRQLVDLLNELFSRCDKLAGQYGVEKIKTLGDCYMAATGVVAGRDKTDIASLFQLGLGIIDIVHSLAAQYGFDLDVRVGISSGQAISGVIGEQNKTFDLWGNTVYLAGLMEATGRGGSVQVCESAHWQLKDRWNFEAQDNVEAQGLGTIATFLYTGGKVVKSGDSLLN